MGVRKKIYSNNEEIIVQIISEAKVCHLSMVDLNGKPYTVPMNFGFIDNCFILHSGPGGKKLELLVQNPHVCISLEINSKLFVRQEEVACSYSMLYQSVVASGKLEFIEDPDEKRKLMNIVMKQYTQKDDYSYNNPAINNVVVMRVFCDAITAHDRCIV
ncbi:pyridoxamine 5'-phosphate oxidase family protein [Bacteroidota bacterium]